MFQVDFTGKYTEDFLNKRGHRQSVITHTSSRANRSPSQTPYSDAPPVQRTRELQFNVAARDIEADETCSKSEESHAQYTTEPPLNITAQYMIRKLTAHFEESFGSIGKKNNTAMDISLMEPRNTSQNQLTSPTPPNRSPHTLEKAETAKIPVYSRHWNFDIQHSTASTAFFKELPEQPASNSPQTLTGLSPRTPIMSVTASTLSRSVPPLPSTPKTAWPQQSSSVNIPVPDLGMSDRNQAFRATVARNLARNNYYYLLENNIIGHQLSLTDSQDENEQYKNQRNTKKRQLNVDNIPEHFEKQKCKKYTFKKVSEAMKDSERNLENNETYDTSHRRSEKTTKNNHSNSPTNGAFFSRQGQTVKELSYDQEKSNPEDKTIGIKVVATANSQHVSLQPSPKTPDRKLKENHHHSQISRKAKRGSPSYNNMVLPQITWTQKRKKTPTTEVYKSVNDSKTSQKEDTVGRERLVWKPYLIPPN